MKFENVTTLFESSEKEEVSCYYREVVLKTLKKILPIEFFEVQATDEETYLYKKEILGRLLPLSKSSQKPESFPGKISFFSLSKSRPQCFKFFFEMISRWLSPERKLNVILVYSTDFRLRAKNEEIYTLCEVMIIVNDPIEYQEIERNFSILQSEIEAGMLSEFYAQRILEIKGLTADDKTAIIQEYIALLVKRFPKIYEIDVFTEMQHVLVSCRDVFKQERQARHLCRIISIFYLFRKLLREFIKKNSQKRYLQLKLFRTVLQKQTGLKNTVGVLVGINFLREQESFGEKNILKAIQHFIPSAVIVEDSFFIHKINSENICLAYLEVSKKDNHAFTSFELKKLRKELPSNLKNRVEHRLLPVFMPRNEEEIMRNILTLTNQLKYVRDIPQISIIFDEQAYAHLYFTVILARVLKTNCLPLMELFKKRKDQSIEYLQDRTKVMGFLRKKYPIEATVFRLKLSKEGFLRADHSINLYKARETVVNEICSAVGEIRDFNGGMITKQHELLSAIRDILKEIKDYDELLLENFFYSLAPVVSRALVDPNAFSTLFLMLVEGLKEFKSESYYLKIQNLQYYKLILVIVEDFSLKDTLQRMTQEIHIPPTELAFATIKVHGFSCIGYLCWAHDEEKKEELEQIVQQALKTWEFQKFNLPLVSPPVSLISLNEK